MAYHIPGYARKDLQKLKEVTQSKEACDPQNQVRNMKCGPSHINAQHSRARIYAFTSRLLLTDGVENTTTR
ncbi:hypothetical protein ACET3Z_022699 [Daucus carota]